MMRSMHLFAGSGGGILGGMLLGHKPVCAVEIEPYCRKVLESRKRDGLLPMEMEIHGDICAFDGRPWRGQVDVIEAGFPCQDISSAGPRTGIHGERSSLFFEVVRLVREVGPRYVFLENVPGLVGRGLDVVLGEMADLGFDAAWQVLSCADLGGNHLRKRIWILCHRAMDESVGDGFNESENGQSNSSGNGGSRWSGESEQFTGSGLLGSDIRGGEAEDRPACGDVADSQCNGLQGRLCGGQDSSREGVLGSAGHSSAAHRQPGEGEGISEPALGGMADGMADWLDIYRAAADFWWTSEPEIGRVSAGVVDRTGQLKALGNGQVPYVAAEAWRRLERILCGPTPG